MAKPKSGEGIVLSPPGELTEPEETIVTCTVHEPKKSVSPGVLDLLAVASYTGSVIDGGLEAINRRPSPCINAAHFLGSHLSSMFSHSNYDTLVVGGGPTGLIITYTLLRAGLKVLNIEQYEKAQQALYGRACVLYAGSMEHLDSMGIYDRIADIGFILDGSVTYKDGQELPNRGWTFVHEALAAGNTYFAYSLGIRQKYIEDAIRSAISELDPTAIRAPVKLINYQITKSNEYPVLATIEAEGKSSQISCKYLVGADGGRSTVRSLGNFPFPGVASPYKWVRLDAVIKTDMPISRLKSVAIESEKYGNVLWLPVDHGRTRIGFVCPEEVYGGDGRHVTKEIIMETAKKALLPFSLEFVSLDWWTVYQIGQRVAERFRDGPVFLAGDSAHSHSSGSAQGMNTGMHDAFNLGWKLAGVLTGKFTEDILDTYDSERRLSAQHLINLDKDVSTLISGKIPAHFNAPPGAEVNIYLDQVFRANAQFTVGLGISYGTNLLNVPSTVDHSTSVEIGHRAPDALLYLSGPVVQKRLRSMLPHTGRFWTIVFAGSLSKESSAEQPILNPNCSAKYRTLTEQLESSNHTIATACDFLTILHGSSVLQPFEAIGVLPLGRVVYDHTGDAYKKYGVETGTGAIVVVRPDGIVSFATSLDGGHQLLSYFATFSRLGCEDQPTSKVGPAIVEGEISIEGEEEVTHRSRLY